jgi:hypothetical protein
MIPATLMIVASLGSALVAIAAAGTDVARDVVIGMAGPLAAVVATWLVVERTWRTSPARLTNTMFTAFAVKMVFFAAYVVAAIKLSGVRPLPFVASFTSYFIALYAVEAVLMTRLFRRAA